MNAGRVVVDSSIVIKWFTAEPFTEQARQILGFPSDLHLRIAISFGYPLDESVLHKSPQRGGRRRLGEIVHWNRW